MRNNLEQSKKVATAEKYVDLLWKFPYLWEVMELKQGWCDSKGGQQGSSGECKTQ